MTGRLALVTGAARGIGQQVALSLAALGADLVLNDLRAEHLDRTATLARDLGARVLVQPFDAGDHAAIGHCLQTAEEQLGTVDVVVCNAALFRFAPSLDLDRAHVEDVFRVNVIGAFDLAQQACRAMIRAGTSGRIIMISSVSAHVAAPRQVGYAASKAALHMLAKSIAIAVAEHGITVNCVPPGGPILTGQTATASRAPGFEEQVRRRVPLGRPGQPADVAGAVCYLAGPEAGFVTGCRHRGRRRAHPGTAVIVDSHVHTWPTRGRRLPAAVRQLVPEARGDVDRLLAGMDAQGVDLALLVQTPWHHHDYSYLHGALREHPGRFVVVGYLDQCNDLHGQSIADGRLGGRLVDKTSSSTRDQEAQMTTTALHIDPDPADAYPDDLYRSSQLARYVDSIDELTETDVERFRRDGYLAVNRVLDVDGVTEVLAGLGAILDQPGQDNVQWEAWAKGKIDTTHGEDRMDLVRKFMWFTEKDPRTLALAKDPAILKVVRELCGCDEVSMFQDMALLKPPGGGREKPWHQDNAYFNYEPGTPIVGVWIALDHATVDNGCMHVLPGTHVEGAVPHFQRRDWQLCDTDVDHGRDTAVPLPPGGALFFHGLLHHGTPANLTDTRRRAVQLHYLPSATPEVPDERRLDIFGHEGKNVTC